MCAVIGALLHDITRRDLPRVNEMLDEIWAASHQRGRDGRGYVVIQDGRAGREWRSISKWTGAERGRQYITDCDNAAFIANLRAEPTTEFVADKQVSDQQPYSCESWNMVHNGTIANDKALRNGKLKTTIDSAAIAEQLACEVQPHAGKTGALKNTFWHFRDVVKRLKGSYAILATHRREPNHMMVAVNYRPVWYVHTEYGLFFASSRDYLPGGYPRVMVEPYTVVSFSFEGPQLIVNTLPLWEPAEPRRALVVCSGGMDSVVAATVAQRRLGYDIELLHFKYGSRAEGPEVKALHAVAKALNVPAHFFPLMIYEKGDSPLLDPHSAVAGGEEGAEFAHEWVPARNLVMLSVATAYAEAHGFDTIILGNNLEEAGAYPDNEPEFIHKMNDLLPFAVADGKRVQIEMPVGNLMKHEIVALGHAVGAPLEHTWSCYRAGDKHCGTCGPCYMRRTAFKINGLPEVISYEA